MHHHGQNWVFFQKVDENWSVFRIVVQTYVKNRRLISVTLLFTPVFNGWIPTKPTIKNSERSCFWEFPPLKLPTSYFNYSFFFLLFLKISTSMINAHYILLLPTVPVRRVWIYGSHFLRGITCTHDWCSSCLGKIQSSSSLWKVHRLEKFIAWNYGRKFPIPV